MTGRADYLVKNDDGGLDVYLNIGEYGSVADINWQPYKNAAGGLGNPNITLVDLDGDGRYRFYRSVLVLTSG